jgi:hypothetical protein
MCHRKPISLHLVHVGERVACWQSQRRDNPDSGWPPWTCALKSAYSNRSHRSVSPSGSLPNNAAAGNEQVSLMAPNQNYESNQRQQLPRTNKGGRVLIMLLKASLPCWEPTTWIIKVRQGHDPEVQGAVEAYPAYNAPGEGSNALRYSITMKFRHLNKRPSSATSTSLSSFPPLMLSRSKLWRVEPLSLETPNPPCGMKGAYFSLHNTTHSRDKHFHTRRSIPHHNI